MSRKNTLPYVVEASKSLASSFTTVPTVINYLDNVGYQIIINTSDSMGTFAIEASLDYRPAASPEFPAGNAGTWSALALGGDSAAPEAAGANDSIIISLHQLPYSAIRIRYTSSIPGTGTCQIIMFAKSVGA